MAHPAKPLPDPATAPLPPSLPVIINVKDLVSPAAGLPGLAAAGQGLRYIDSSASVAPSTTSPGSSAKPAGKDRRNPVLKGLQDLQQLQKQTIAVLESVKGTLDDIAQVLRSPEATRGMEKQQNAATLLAKGFAREAVEQSQGAVGLLPANPEAHLLLSLSLAADQQFDAALAAARKGIALFDRRHHPLAIECGLLHALAALGCAPEALDRWSVIVDSLPLPVLFEQMGRIAACFPSAALGGGADHLDDLITRRLAREEESQAPEASTRAIVRAGPVPRAAGGRIHLRADEIPAPALFAGLDASSEFSLAFTHRALLGQIARRLQLARDPGEIVKFLTECVVPLGNRGLDRSAGALGRASLKRLLKQHADAMTLHRAMAKLELAGATVALHEVTSLLTHWRREGNKVARAKTALIAGATLVAGGVGLLIYIAATHPAQPQKVLGVDLLLLAPLLMVVGAVLGLLAIASWTWKLVLPEGRPPLSHEERAYLNTPSVRHALR